MQMSQNMANPSMFPLPNNNQKHQLLQEVLIFMVMLSAGQFSGTSQSCTIQAILCMTDENLVQTDIYCNFLKYFE